MIHDVQRSIAAIATPQGYGLRGVIRCSGKEVFESLANCCTTNDGAAFSPPGTEWSRTGAPTSVDATISVPRPIGPVDCELLTWPSGRGYTRQPSVEIHCTASPPILHAIMARLADCGIRQAAPGEFTLRAFLSGRIDLTRAEAVLGVIDSRSESEMKVALRQLAGGLADPLESIREKLLDVAARIEAGLDFVEEDIEFISNEEVRHELTSAQRELELVRDQVRQRSVREPVVRVAIIGRPNAGKSSLFNAVMDRAGQRGEALVSDVAGTTRDYTTRTIESCGVSFQLIDTAGTTGSWSPDPPGDGRRSPIDHQAELLARSAARDAHISLLCIDSSEAIADADRDRIAEIRSSGESVVVLTKCDLAPAWQENGPPDLADAIAVSATTGAGLDQLLDRLVERADDDDGESGRLVIGTAERCGESLNRAARELKEACGLARSGLGQELVASSLRVVLDELAVVTGRVYTEDILDHVFSRFCIGK